MSEESVVGFDFGTTNSLVTVVKGGRAINFLDDEGLPFPSIVCYEGTSTIVGREAKERVSEAGLGVRGNVVRSPKMLLGQESIFIEGVERNPVDIVSDVLKFVSQQACAGRRGRDLGNIERAVVTIPVDMEGYRRAALREAFQLAGISIVQFVHEPLAALYGYFRSQGDMAMMLRQYNRKLILVFDWGGGTLDLTLCRLVDGRLVQVVNDGTDEVGGDEFDDVIKNEVIQHVLRARGLDETAKIHPDAKKRLLHRCERAKIDLSTREHVELYVPGFFQAVPDEELDYSLSRDGLEEIIGPLLDKGFSRISKLLDDADVSSAQVAACLATGGMANMPSIKARLHEWFGPERVHVSERSGTLIAEGAAWIAHDDAKLHLAKNIELLLARNSYMTLVKSGTTMPNESDVQKNKFHLYCSDPRDGFAKFQLCAPIRSKSKVLPSDRRIPLENLIIKVDAKAKPFHERLELDISIDENLILKASAHSLNMKARDEGEVHNLEFGLSFPNVDSSKRHDEMVDVSEGVTEHELGSLVFRSNITDREDDSLVPGELIETYKPYYFDRRLNVPEIQWDERAYYQPCDFCKRAYNDPLCHCNALMDKYI